ncbi:P-loop ATPase, Sll1717 family [Streptomyces sp. 6N223]|uniref:P-loop ATPase, Sll1717 family n=1 Tax=Streptomyces sp. 6N223 TaxID=3457412 RepID=UPI003FD1538B
MIGQQDVVRRLFFGRDDAENDLADGLLREGFVPTSAYEAALTGRKSLIIGRKGSGKSAICRRLASKDGYAGASVLITPDDAAGDEIRRFELRGLTPDTAKSLIWRYVFAVHAARHLVAHTPRRWRRAPAAVRALRAFLKANDEAGDERLYDDLRRGALGLQAASLSLNAFGIVEASAELAGGGAGGSEGARATRLLEVLERGVAAAFAEVDYAATHPPLLFLVDQLEQVWTVDPDSHALVTGLLLAAKHVTSEYGRAARCVLFLRSDIYDSLNFSDGDKFHSDELRIAWDKRALRDLAVARASASLRRQVGDVEMWRDIFPQTVQGAFTPDYLFSRTLLRPRDAIQFLTLCRDTAAGNGHPVVGEIDVWEATRQFSQWKLTDLAKEYLVNYPFLRALFAFFENAGPVVTREELAARFERRRETLHAEYPAYAQYLTPQGIVDALFSINFLGVRRGNDVVYVGGTRAPVQPDEDEFHIHPCFRPALGADAAPDARPAPPAEPQRYAVPSWSAYQQRQSGADVGFGLDRRSRLPMAYERAITRVLEELDRSAVPASRRSELSGELRAQLLAPHDSDAHVLTGAEYLNRVAARILREDPALARAIEDEVRALRRVVGGAEGRGTGSSSG